jgi:hypothetical protein
LPKVLLLHMNPMLEDEIRQEIAEVARSVNASITLAREGMELEV